MRILYVEDSESFSREVRETWLVGHDVTQCWTLSEAKATWKSGAFDLILLDYDLPDGQGEDIAELVRASGDPIPIIANSNSLRKNQLLVDAGGNAIVTKGEEAEKLPGLLVRFAP